MPDRMGIPTHQSFINATTLKPTGIISKVEKAIKGRGSNMALIDAAYLAWESSLVLNDVNAKKAALSQLIKATAWWLSLKREKDSPL